MASLIGVFKSQYTFMFVASKTVSTYLEDIYVSRSKSHYFHQVEKRREKIQERYGFQKEGKVDRFSSEKQSSLFYRLFLYFLLKSQMTIKIFLIQTQRPKVLKLFKHIKKHTRFKIELCEHIK